MREKGRLRRSSTDVTRREARGLAGGKYRGAQECKGQVEESWEILEREAY